MRRREFIAGLGSAAAWPVVARAQHRTIAVIGVLGDGTPDTQGERYAEIKRGLSDIGYVEGQNLAIEYLWAGYHADLIPTFAAELVRRQVSLIFVNSTAAALAAKAATKTIPIVFSIGVDPVEAGLVANLSRPGGNVTGTYNLNIGVASKRLELLRELVPGATSIAYLANSANAVVVQAETRELQAAARVLGVRLPILNAGGPSEFEAAFATLAHEQAGALLVSSDVFFTDHSNRLVVLADRHVMPAIYSNRNAPAAGGLMSYGTNPREVRRQNVSYIGRILKGEKPADLPAQQVVKIELVINLKTAKTLGLTIPEALLATADEVIQ